MVHLAERKSYTIVEALELLGGSLPTATYEIYRDWSVSIWGALLNNGQVYIECRDVYVDKRLRRDAIRAWGQARVALNEALYFQGFDEFYTVAYGPASRSWCKHLFMTNVGDFKIGDEVADIYRTEVVKPW